MKNNLKAETLDKIIAEYKTYENLVIERKELLQAILLGTGKYGNYNLNFSEKEGRIIAIQSAILNGKLDQLNKILFDMIYANIEAKKFQNSLEKSEGVVSPEARKNEFAGGTLTATGKNNPESFRSFNINYVSFDCDEEGNPLTNKPK